MTFEYVGDNFYKDMAALSEKLQDEGYFVKQRRRDLKPEQLKTTNWWAPLKILGSNLGQTPFAGDEEMEEDEFASVSRNGGIIDEEETKNSISYDSDDWSESIHY